MPYKFMYAFIDESDSLCHGRCLVIGAWITAYEEDWFWRMKSIRRHLRYPFEMHFHKISRDSNDRRYLLAKAVAEALVEHQTSWYARCIYVNKTQEALWKRSMGKRGQTPTRQSETHAEFLTIMADRFFEHAKTETMGLVPDAKKERWFDEIFLRDLVKQLNAKLGERRYMVFPGDSKREEMLQIADLIVGCVAQMFHPVDNPNKERLADILRPLANPNVNRIGVWPWSAKSLA